jgi:hypothetical protein
MFGIPGLRFTCPLVWTYVLVIPVIISFVLSTFSIYIHLKGKMFFLASVIWTYVLVIPFDYFICCLIFVYYVSMAVCSCHLLFGTVLEKDCLSGFNCLATNYYVPAVTVF